ncbi:MAG: hypothetical protein ACREGC_03650 [Minisyncoccia bacterium]
MDFESTKNIYIQRSNSVNKPSFEDSPELSGAAPCIVLQSSTFEGETIVDCREVTLSYRASNKENDLKNSLAEGWKLVTIAWVRDETNNYGHEPAVCHVLRAVIVKTEKKVS